jgi:glutathione S-transferase
MITLCGFAVSNYYNKLKLVLLEKGIPFEECLVYPWQKERLEGASPLGKIPFIETPHGALSESQPILEYLEDAWPERPLYPREAFERARCRELVQHLELNVEWVARRMYKESFFGGIVSDETKREAKDRLVRGLEAVAGLCAFSPFIAGPRFTVADCVARAHFPMIRATTEQIYGENLLDRCFPDLPAYLARLDERPHFRRVAVEREAALAAFAALDVAYEG